MASLPDGKQKRLVILSDGNENLGDALGEAQVASNNEVAIDVVPLTSPQRHEVLIEKMTRAQRGQNRRADRDQSHRARHARHQRHLEAVPRRRISRLARCAPVATAKTSSCFPRRCKRPAPAPSKRKSKRRRPPTPSSKITARWALSTCRASRACSWSAAITQQSAFLSRALRAGKGQRRNARRRRRAAATHRDAALRRHHSRQRAGVGSYRQADALAAVLRARPRLRAGDGRRRIFVRAGRLSRDRQSRKRCPSRWTSRTCSSSPAAPWR